MFSQTLKNYSMNIYKNIIANIARVIASILLIEKDSQKRLYKKGSTLDQQSIQNNHVQLITYNRNERQTIPSISPACN